MREPNLIELISDREISRLIQYLDPDIQEIPKGIGQRSDVEGLIMLILLLGGVIACFAVLFCRVAE